MGDYHFWLHHFAGASFLAKGIYSLLAFLSVLAWAIIIRKGLLLRRNARGTRAFREVYRKGRRDPLGLYRHLLVSRKRFPSPLTALFLSGCESLQVQLERRNGSVTKAPAAAAAGRPEISLHQFHAVRRSIETAQDAYFLDIEHHLVHLATTVSVAPFLGLLGTVWGILEAFQAMGQQGSTGMTSFGPGISEALISTVAGLVVAIPALLGYNFIGARIRELAGEAAHFASEFLSQIEKEFVRE